MCFILESKEAFKNSKTDMHLQFRMKMMYDLRLCMISQEMMGLPLQLVVFLWVRKLKTSGEDFTSRRTHCSVDNVATVKAYPSHLQEMGIYHSMLQRSATHFTQ